ncbi:PH domain-containing protein [Metabacillus sp. GX 13764]|uniref:PH domain-containing protein n=1 Tax=Metabacillus kandeliae TaxID=2900151 RepID=UPI001E4F4B94|nr:PH domain-containing protein [Metabacillus kandeliae]MCD7036704.1 PH domain-containing protein [Metabacillus kandeliae]
MMNKPKRLHPAAVILNVGKMIKEMIIPLVIFLFFNGNNGLSPGWKFAAAGGIFVLILVFSILSWVRFTYRVEDGELRIESGIFVQKKRYIPIDRIQTIHTSEGLVQQLFGLVKLQVETAGGGKQAEGELKAIRKKNAEELRSVLNRDKQQEEVLVEGREEQTHPVFRISNKELLIAASTSSGIGVILPAAFALYSQVDQLIPWDSLFKEFSFLAKAGFAVYAAGILIGFFIVWLISMLGTIFKYTSFKAERREDKLYISGGLLEKNQMTIPLSRIQAIKVTEGVLREPFGYASVQLVTAGSGKKGEPVSATLFPIVKKEKVSELLKEFAPSYTLPDTLKHAAKRAKTRYVLLPLIPVLLIAALAVLLFRPWGLLALLLLPAALLFGLKCHRDAGYSIAGQQLSIQSRSLGKTTALLQKRHMQIFRSDQSFFQKRKNLASIHTSVISGMLGARFSLFGTELRDAMEIESWYSRKPGRTIGALKKEEQEPFQPKSQIHGPQY